MNDPKYLFQYCQKLVILNEAKDAVLLAKRKGEADYDGTFSFIGGKMETSDEGLVEALKREKYEEIGMQAQLLVCVDATRNLLFRKTDGNAMIIPHYAALFSGGVIELNDEYSEYRWVKLTDLEEFEPKIKNIPEFTDWAVTILKAKEKTDLTII